MNRFRLAAIDLDGTLLPDDSSGVHLARVIGHATELAELEARYNRGEISNEEVATADGAYYRGHRVADMAAYLADISVISGAEEGLTELRAAGIDTILATVAWTHASEYFRVRLGFESASGCGLEVDIDGTFTGRVAVQFDELDKLAFVEAEVADRRIEWEQVVAIGDSRSDVPIFRKAGLAIALNGSAEARQAAHVSVDGQDFRDVLPFILGSQTGARR